MIREEEVFKIGQFAKPHGIKGELSLVTNSDVLEDAEDPYIVCGLPHSMDQCVDGVYDKCDIEYEIPLIGHYLKKEDVYYTSVKTAIVMLEANGILTIDNDHNVEGAMKYWKKALEMGSESKTLKQKIEKKKYIAE